MIQIDMQMPSNCLDCPACNEYLMCAIPANGRGWGENDVKDFSQGRPEWCPMKEQETGHWIYLENCSNSGVYCSECNTKVFDNYPFKKKFSYFCPHCGTRMEGETERR